MRRLFLRTAAITIIAIVGCFVFHTSQTKISAETATWTTGAMPTLAVGPAVSGPLPPQCSPTDITYQSFTTTAGAFSAVPRDVAVSMCSTSNFIADYASPSAGVTSYGYIKPKTNYAYRVVDELERPTGLLPIPNSGRAIFTQSDGNVNGGRSLRILSNFASTGTFGPVYGSLNEMAYKLTNPGQPLKDGAGNIIHMMDGYAFSANGRWMIIEADNIGLLRIDTETKQMQLISTEYYTYGGGFRPVLTLAISDDGESAIRSGVSLNNTTVFDLSNCQTTPFIKGSSTNQATGCVKRNVQDNIVAQFSGFRAMYGMKYSADGKNVSGRIQRTGALGVIENFSMTYSVAGYQVPQTSYLALGDSFSSGEGAYDYESETDQKTPPNFCHTSKNSYPYLAAASLGITNFHSVACSGAKSTNYHEKSQATSLLSEEDFTKSWTPGIKPQAEYLKRVRASDAITISMIGNDIGFGNKLRRCILASDACFHFREDREAIAKEINLKFDSLVNMYVDIKTQASSAKVYVLGYPNLFSEAEACEPNALTEYEERIFSRAMVRYLNTTIKSATEKAGVQYIDVEQAFTGQQLCDPGRQKAVNGFTWGDSGPITIGPYSGPVGNESYHPNKLGQQLFSQALLAQSQSFTKQMPTPNSSAKPPTITSTAYTNLVDGAPSGNTINRGIYSELEGLEVLIKNKTTPIRQTEKALKANSVYEVWINSTPIKLGDVNTNSSGELAGEIAVPQNISPGFHTLHVYGQDIAGENIDLYKTLYVAETQEDIDGDGAPNNQEKCLVVEPINIDVDRDGRDDACDAEISDPPADSTPPQVSGALNTQPNALGWLNASTTISWSSIDPEPSSGIPTQPTSTEVNNEGEYVVTSDPSCDPLNNCATGSMNVKLDSTAPTLGTPEWTQNPKSITGSTKISIPVLDLYSGVSSAEYFIGDNDPGLGNGATMQIDPDHASTEFGSDFPSGVFRITVRAKDFAGNWSENVSDFLVVYGPKDSRISGRRAVIPSTALGDRLPGLVTELQQNKLRFGLHVMYNKQNQIHPNSNFFISYKTGTKCANLQKAQNCHTTYLDSQEINWLAFQSTTGIFEGKAMLSVDGIQTPVKYRVHATDAQKNFGSGKDRIKIEIFDEHANSNVDQVIYQVNAELAKGDIVIKTK